MSGPHPWPGAQRNARDEYAEALRHGSKYASPVILDLYKVALFESEPRIGAVNPAGEVRYVGYKRLLSIFHNRAQIDTPVFPAVQDGARLPPMTFLAVMEDSGKVVHVRAVETRRVVS